MANASLMILLLLSHRWRKLNNPQITQIPGTAGVSPADGASPRFNPCIVFFATLEAGETPAVPMKSLALLPERLPQRPDLNIKFFGMTKVGIAWQSWYPQRFDHC